MDTHTFSNTFRPRTLEHLKMYLRIFSLAVLTVSQLGSTASAQLSNFFEDFEGLNLTMMNLSLIHI